jgi:hypothetical protein
VAVFAHNEARRIEASIESVERAAGGRPLSITVLANGCTDRTVDVVRALAETRAHLTLVEIALADKANAWNTYVHDTFDEAAGAAIDAHFFVDGDVRIGDGAFRALAAALEHAPTANAAGGMPATGRDRDAWSRRMVERGFLAGNLYALRGAFVQRIRAGHVRMPIGFIGEDWLVSFLAGTDLGAVARTPAAPLVVFSPDALFSFRSLSPVSPRDYRTYAHRLWRYALRDVQFEMLLNFVRRASIVDMPRHVDDLYRDCLPPSRLVWVGRRTPLRFAAVQHVRSLRSRARRA